MEELLLNVAALKITLESLSPEQLKQIPTPVLDTVIYLIESTDHLIPNYDIDKFLTEEILVVSKLIKTTNSIIQLILLDINESNLINDRHS
jgi:hypothetical protein